MPDQVQSFPMMPLARDQLERHEYVSSSLSTINQAIFLDECFLDEWSSPIAALLENTTAKQKTRPVQNINMSFIG
jgi:hypothetical protein